MPTPKFSKGDRVICQGEIKTIVFASHPYYSIRPPFPDGISIAEAKSLILIERDRLAHTNHILGSK